ncbi:Nif11 family protein [Geofilum rubicundum]|uniref:Uncharacterized protein n=1 Tax=Geofilum rubicundum JCM 15548 TaxID=1236989 RepID=A0A0E9LSL4_9BACT|nr:Nif11 family protein [Geofilum rubicundum]GAO28562.1 hypothetical protein JCM15548_1671 [Geofilum rubicundum JCM 15548]
MPISHAYAFLKRFEKDAEFRWQCNACQDQKELMDMLFHQELSFTPLELENTFNALLVQCQSHEQGEYVLQLKTCLARFM